MKIRIGLVTSILVICIILCIMMFINSMNKLPNEELMTTSSMKKELNGIEDILKRQTGKSEVSLTDLENLFREYSPVISPAPISIDIPEIEFLNSKIDSIYQYIQQPIKPEMIKEILPEPRLSTCRVLLPSNEYVGKRATFTVISEYPSKGKVRKSDSLSVYRTYVIDTTGQYISKNELIGEKIDFNYPVEGFEISSTQPGKFQVLVETNAGQDTINTIFQQEIINYSITTEVDVLPKRYDLAFLLSFSDEIIHDIHAEITLNISQNQEEFILLDTIYIPSGTTEFRKKIPYMINGRKPYQFTILNTVFRELKSSSDVIYELFKPSGYEENIQKQKLLNY